jgi:dTDP-4-amino-4,6-dideoxygalactose transaminase
VLEGFEPDLSGVEAEAKAGDLVLVAAYFGLPIGPGTRQALGRRPDLRVVEDRAQALGAEPVVGGWRLHSPRKLLGVADGGLLVACDAVAPLPMPTEPADSDALWAAPSLRAADPQGLRNAVWHAANQAKEAAMSVSSHVMTDRSLSILARASLEDLAGPRLRNWRTLDERLRAWSALPPDPTSPPLGYVLRLAPDLRDGLLRKLHAERIFAAVHWPRIAGPDMDFPREAQWARELVTLPCDHRYGEADMARIADSVTAFLA